MECKIEFLDNPKEFYEPSQKIKAQVTLVASKTEKINSKLNCFDQFLARFKMTFHIYRNKL